MSRSKLSPRQCGVSRQLTSWANALGVIACVEMEWVGYNIEDEMKGND